MTDLEIDEGVLMGPEDQIQALREGQSNLWEAVAELRQDMKDFRRELADLNKGVLEVATTLGTIAKDVQELVKGDGTNRCVRHTDKMEYMEERIGDLKALVQRTKEDYEKDKVAYWAEFGMLKRIVFTGMGGIAVISFSIPLLLRFFL